MKAVNAALALVGIVGAVALAPTAAATTVLQVDVPAMTRTAEWVVRARVTDVRSVDLRPHGGTFATDVSLHVHDVYGGEDVPERHTFRLPGGRGDDGLALRIPGMPQFRPGEEVVLFLERAPGGHLPVGLGQGVWRVVRDAAGRPWVRQSGRGAHVVRRGADGRLVHAPPRLHSMGRTLQSLVAEIREEQVKQRIP